MRTLRDRNVWLNDAFVGPTSTPSARTRPATGLPVLVSVAVNVVCAARLTGTGNGVTVAVSRLTSGPSGTPASPPSGIERTSAQLRLSANRTAGDVTHRFLPPWMRYTLGFESSFRRLPSGVSHRRTVAVVGADESAVTVTLIWGAGRVKV